VLNVIRKCNFFYLTEETDTKTNKFISFDGINDNNHCDVGSNIEANVVECTYAITLNESNLATS